MGLRPAKSHEKLGTIASPAGLVGRTPWSAADAPVGLLASRMMLMSLCRLRDEGVPRGPAGPPHHLPEGGFSTLLRCPRAGNDWYENGGDRGGSRGRYDRGYSEIVQIFDLGSWT